MAPLLSAVVVAVAALASGRWLAEFVERTAVVACGPLAGEPALASAAAAAVPLAYDARGATTATSVSRPAAGAGAVGVAAAGVGGAVAWAGYGAWLPALVFTAGLGLLLAAVDVRSHRLPDALVLPAYPVLALLLCAGALAGRTGLAPLVRAAEGGVLTFGVVYLLAVAVPAGFGFGDVKLTGLLGAVLGGYGWSAVIGALFTGFVYGGVCAAVLLATRRLGRTDRLAFGPFLVAGALTVVLVR